jgi:BNR repeat-like domain
VVELADGTLLSWARTDQGCQYGFRSRDGGNNWTAPKPLTLRSPAAPASIVRLPDSPDLLAVYVDYSGQFPFKLTSRTYSGRSPLVAAVSSDGGITWRTRKLLEGDPQRDYCYTAIHFTADSALFAYLAGSNDPAKPALMCIRRVSLASLTAPDNALSVRARTVLHEVMNSEESWIKIHAAEALIVGGETAAVRDHFLKLIPTIDSLVYRVGIWRVLANTAATLTERMTCVAQVERIFLNPNSSDRSQALETLCKLRHPVSGPTLDAVRKMAADPQAPLRGLALWALRVVQEPGALESLSELLQSGDEGQRLVAAYAFRVMQENDTVALGKLAQAADRESPQSRAYPYLVSAAFSLGADPGHRTTWRTGLEKIVANESATDAARFEACQCLLQHLAMDDLPEFAGLLASQGNDTKIGAALAILYVSARH